jgi:hypothetical protein
VLPGLSARNKGGSVFMSAAAANSEKVRKTVRLPRRLYDEAESCVEKKLVAAENFNEFLVAALSAYVKLLKRKQTDAAFAAMAEDADYQKESRLIAEEFSQSDWEAFATAEKES